MSCEQLDPYAPAYRAVAATIVSGYKYAAFKNATSQLKIFVPDAREGRLGRWSAASIFRLTYARSVATTVGAPVSKFAPFGERAFDWLHKRGLLDNDEVWIMQVLSFKT